MKTVEAIIERLKKDKSSNGCAGVFKSWVEMFETHADDYLHGKIIGFLWGLNAMSCISDYEHDTALKELLNHRYSLSAEEAPE